jgi:hypothetical protein
MIVSLLWYWWFSYIVSLLALEMDVRVWAVEGFACCNIDWRKLRIFYFDLIAGVQIKLQ